MQEKLEQFAGYVMTCKTENTPEWMEGLADWLNEVADAVGAPVIFEFNGDEIRSIGIGD